MAWRVERGDAECAEPEAAIFPPSASVVVPVFCCPVAFQTARCRWLPPRSPPGSRLGSCMRLPVERVYGFGVEPDLSRDHLGVQTVSFQQILMCAHLGDAAVDDHHYEVGAGDG